MATCILCEAALPAGAKNCPACGTPAVSGRTTESNSKAFYAYTCVLCEAALPAGAKNCPACGTPAALGTISELDPERTPETGTGSMAQPRGSRLRSGVGLIIGGIAVFIVCSIVQGIAGTSMFSYSYYATGNFLTDVLVHVTWWPGWLATAALILRGAARLLSSQG